MRFMYALWILVALPSILAQNCHYCSNLGATFEVLGCMKNCRRNSCITGYNCRNLPKDETARCFFQNKYLEKDKTTTEYYAVDSTKSCQYRCSCLTGQCVLKNVNCKKETNAIKINCGINLQYMKKVFFENSPALSISPSSPCELLFATPSLPPSTCTTKLHCCKFGDKQYQWLSNITFVGEDGMNYYCSCNCSPYMECMEL
ncbi:hypothetical protein FQA39_LY03255 [Lamprigera yunnana]|nr:hypothetical protein FQA39_LY03255 [Lamprigera yunnana]